jgi:EpsI family protein
MKKPQFWVILLLLSATATLLYARGDKDRVPPSQPLSGMPQTIGSWTSEDIPINQDVLDVLGHGVFLNRVYKAEGSDAAVQTAASSAEIGLFIGYFPTQRTGQSIHSPQNCLPGSGWTFEKSGVTDVTDDAGKTIRIGEYVISDGTSKDEVLYWYQSHGRSIASDYSAKLYMLADSIRYERTDAALVRIITPIRRGEEVSVAHTRAVDFVKRLSPLLPRYIPD